MLGWVSMAICAWLGWRRDTFLRWPLAVIVTAAAAYALLVYFGGPTGPPKNEVMLRGALGAIILGTLAYWLAFGVRAFIARRH